MDGHAEGGRNRITRHAGGNDQRGQNLMAKSHGRRVPACPDDSVPAELARAASGRYAQLCKMAAQPRTPAAKRCPGERRHGARLHGRSTVQNCANPAGTDEAARTQQGWHTVVLARISSFRSTCSPGTLYVLALQNIVATASTTTAWAPISENSWSLHTERVGIAQFALKERILDLQGIAGHGFYDDCVVPIIENTARECELTDRLQVCVGFTAHCTPVPAF